MQQLLGPGDPPPLHRPQRGGQGAAAVALRPCQQGRPKALGDLGITDEELSRHIGWDIGGLDAAIELSEALDAPLLASGYSRLVIDCNRWPGGEGSTPEVSDGTPRAGERASQRNRSMRAPRPASGPITARSTASSTA